MTMLAQHQLALTILTWAGIMILPLTYVALFIAVVIGDRIERAIAAGTRSAETNEDLAQSEGCQSSAKAHRPNSVGHLLHKRSD